MPQSSEAEKKAWNKRKEEYLKLRARHGSFVSKRRVAQSIAAQNPAANPDPMTRQVRRAAERRARKMPLSMTSTEWHRQNQLPKVKAGRRRKGAA
tara:strand:+ start:11997 stop:12281 length:285 start_codon:yes stop_codon:yes gene_type:complete